MVALVMMMPWSGLMALTRTIAHRGHWTAPYCAQNSRASLQEALALDVYGSEIDLWLTTDGHLMANHDYSLKGVAVMESDYGTCRGVKLDNGESMPELTEFLEMMEASPSRTKLIIEIKDHGCDSLNIAAASAAVAAVREHGLESRVEYISFSPVVCERIISDAPEAYVAYLSGGVAPEELKKKGYTGLDYHINEFRKNPQWVDEAHSLGMTVNVWTVSSPEEIGEMIDLGVDFITTNDPLECERQVRRQ